MFDTKSSYKDVWRSLDNSRFGRALRIGTGEAFGWGTEGMFSVGKKGSTLGYNFADAKRMMKSGMSKDAVRAKVNSKKWLGGGGWMGAAFTGYQIYEGYQRNGVMGALGGAAESIAYSIAPRMLGAVVGSAGIAIAGGAMVVGGVALAGYGLGEAAIEHKRKIRDIEFGGGQIVDAIQSSGAATMRQRSISALQNTHLNSRMAMGNEAIMMHRIMR